MPSYREMYSGGWRHEILWALEYRERSQAWLGRQLRTSRQPKGVSRIYVHLTLSGKIQYPDPLKFNLPQVRRVLGLNRIMTPLHPRWEEFARRLEGPEGCNFHEEGGETVWSCGGGMDKSCATRILQMMGDLDIRGSLRYFDDHGGHCDCEILFNVAKASGA